MYVWVWVKIAHQKLYDNGIGQWGYRLLFPKSRIYEDISSASDEDLMCNLEYRVDSDLRKVSRIVSDKKKEELWVTRSVSYLLETLLLYSFF